MTTVNPQQAPPPAQPSRRPLVLALIGCAVLLLCGVVAAAAAGGAWFLRRGAVVTATEPAVEYILDASPRMADAADVGGSRLSVAQGVLAEIVRPANPSLTAGLRVFGTGAQADACKDTDLVVPLAPANQSAISTRVLEVASGAAADAAMGEAMIAAIRDLAATEGPHTLVVVTGGADSCNAEAGQLIAQEAERAGIRLQTFVVGYQVPDEDAEAIRGMVEEVGATNYYHAADLDELREILAAIQKFVDDPATTFPSITLGTPAVVVEATRQATPVAEATTGAVDPNNPDPTQAVVPGETPVDGTGYDAQTACDHPYFPLRQGASWTYSADYGSYTWSVTEVTGDLEQATATMHLEMTEGSIDYHWTCTREGLVSYDFGNVNAGGGVFHFEVTSSSGTWLPPAEQLVPGATWDNVYSMQSTIDAGGESLTSVTDVSQSFTATGIESATSEAGTFDTLRVDGTGTFNSQTAGIPAINFESTSTSWYAYGVGMIRQTSSSSGASSSSTLVSYSIP